MTPIDQEDAGYSDKQQPEYHRGTTSYSQSENYIETRGITI